MIKNLELFELAGYSFKREIDSSYFLGRLRTALKSALVFFVSGTKIFAMANEAGELIKPNWKKKLIQSCVGKGSVTLISLTGCE